MNEKQQLVARRNSSIFRWVSLGLFSIGSLCIFYFNDAEFTLSGRPTLDMLLLAGAFNVFLYVWIRKSNWSKATQVKSIIAVALIQAALLACFQVEGVLGNGRPVFAWRWASLPADLVAPRSSNDQTADLKDAIATWPQFRGRRRDGVADSKVVDWAKRPPKELWRKPIGAGWSSFVVVGEYCYTMEQRGDEECIVCLDLKTGVPIWSHANLERFREISGGEGPRSTPTFDSGFLYSLGATGVLNCVDARNGDLLWTVDVLRKFDTENCLYGMCGSPLVVDGKVIISPGGRNSSLVAISKLNGSVVWQCGNSPASYSSPTLAEFGGIDQVVIFNGEGIYSHTLDDGRKLWSIPWVSNEAELNNVCEPISIGDDRLFVSSSYGNGCAMFRIQRKDVEFFAERIWTNKNLKSKFASAVFDGEFIYGLDEGILVCLDPETGSRMWKNGRYGHGQLIVSGNYLVVQSEKGFLALVERTPDEFREVARVPALKERTWVHPVVAGKFLLTRSDRNVVCFALETN